MTHVPPLCALLVAAAASALACGDASAPANGAASSVTTRRDATLAPVLPGAAPARARPRGSAGRRGSAAARAPVPASHADELVRARGFLRDLLAAGDSRVRSHESAVPATLAATGSPRATLVTCSDAHSDATALLAQADNDVFVVSNLGNQIGLAAGSVEYGVRHLDTPVLAIVGHTGCGAVQAALGSVEGGGDAARRDLAHLLSTTPGRDGKQAWGDAVVANVHRQVAAAVQAFASEVADGSLTVLGLVEDLPDELGKGAGRIVLVDVNGRTDAELLRELGAPPVPTGSSSGAALEPPADPAARSAAAEPPRATVRAPLPASAHAPAPAAPPAPPGAAQPAAIVYPP